MSKKGYKMTNEHKKRISLALAGRRLSAEHAKRMGRTKIGNKNMLGKHHTIEAREKMSLTKKGMIWSEEVCKQRSLSRRGKPSFMLGKHHTKETRQKMSLLRRGQKHWNWQGGITSLRRMIRNSLPYKMWTNQCFFRDGYVCRRSGCNQRGGELRVHHIVSFEEIFKDSQISNFEDALNCVLLWDIDNGITLCKKCHKEFHHLYGQKGAMRNKIMSFIYG